MKKTDARTLSQDVQEAQRIQIIRLRESGIVGESKPHCSTVWQRYMKQVPESLVKSHGGQRDLTPEQEA